ncbi:MAG: hypothetical protein ACRD4O_01535 [Bryobacteraceae bacterium]
MERYLLSQTGEEELEMVESHILACESCVTRLEILELDIAAMKRALYQIEARLEARAAARTDSRWRHWFAVPTLSWAGVIAAVALVIAVVPHFWEHNRAAVDFSLSANRGMETVVVPEGRPLHLTLNANDLPEGAAGVTVVDSNGVQIWRGAGQIENNRISVTVPRIAQSGTHFVRLYSRAAGGAPPELLREFSIDVR